MATLKIKRTNEWVNMARNYKIYIDGQFVGRISNGATKEFPITAGQHTVRAKIDWCSSPDIFINIDTNEIEHLTVGSFKYSNWIMLLGLVTIGLHPLLKVLAGFGYTIILLIPLFLFHVYYITIGRNKYLSLSETNAD